MRLKSIGWVVIDPKTRQPIDRTIKKTRKGALDKAADLKAPSVAEVFIQVTNES